MKYFILSILILTYIPSKSQITTIFQECNNTNALELHNDTLYIGCSFTGTIYRMPLDVPNPTIEIFKTGIVALQDFCVVDNYLFVSQRGIPADLRRVIKLDLLASDPPIEIVHLFSNPYGLTKDENFLYINDTQNIYKLPLQVQNPSPQVIISNTGHNIGGTGMVIIDNHLYLTATNQLKKYNLSTLEETIVFSSSNNLKGICIGENDQTIYSVNFTDDYVYKHDLNNHTNSPLIHTQLFSPGEIVYHNNSLYVSNMEGGQVNKINLSTLGVDDFTKRIISVYPNPSDGNFTLRLLDNSVIHGEISLVDIYGKTIFKQNIDSEETTINYNEISSGIYVLKCRFNEKVWTEKVVIK
jgi:hypothetical protein